MAREDVKISVDPDRMFAIQGEKKRKESPDKTTQLRSEIDFGQFRREFSLPDNISPDKISAKFENGVLEVQMPKVEPAFC